MQRVLDVRGEGALAKFGPGSAAALTLGDFCRVGLGFLDGSLLSVMGWILWPNLRVLKSAVNQFSDGKV